MPIGSDTRAIADQEGELPEWRGTDRYEVIGCLGRGGMGVVYEVFDREQRKIVALKTLLRYDPAGLYLFKQEFRTLADVRHTNLVHLHELVVTEGSQVFFTMELVRGSDFRQYVQADTRTPSPLPTLLGGSRARKRGVRDAAIERAAPDRTQPPNPARMPADEGRLRRALAQLLGGVQALHGAGKVHRDIKPSNVLVTHEGRVVILDFGVAAELERHGEVAAASGEVVGTARYMAPEQADDTPPTPASDWYSIGVMLYEALVGRPPFMGAAVDVMTMKSMMDPQPPSECVRDVPPDLEALCLALLRRDPDQRPLGPEIAGRLGVSSSSPPLPPRRATEASSAFIGREKHLETLRDSFEAARAGRSVTVRVGGASGMGKSTVVGHFLDELTEHGEAIVLRGRAYEREAVPYKAIDSVIDALSRHLLRLAAAQDKGNSEDKGDAPLDAGPDLSALARLFPVLRRLPTVRESAASSDHAPQDARRRAFEALRALVGSLGRLQPIVIFIDDAQWGDLDSVELLLELVRPPAPPPLLLVMTYRDDEATTSRFLVEMRDRWPAGAEVRDVSVDPLAIDDALQLALTLLGTADPTAGPRARAIAQAVARESRGSPFLIEELVSSSLATGGTGTTLDAVNLEQMVGNRLDQLQDDPRRLLEIVAVGGRPLSLAAVAAAAGVASRATELATVLCGRRFARMGLREGADVIETSHDRIRETIVASLPPATLAAHHGRLARVLGEDEATDPEALAVHWLGAGDADRAARFGETAAGLAEAKLAFDRCARLLRMALENTAPSSPDAHRLRAKLAQALRLGGRYAESAGVYLAVAEEAPDDQRLEFQRAAAEQFLLAGRIDEGTALLRGVLSAVGMKAPRSPVAAIFWLVVYRAWLAVVGVRCRERAPREVRPADRVRIDALFTASMGFAIVDAVLGACMQARQLIEAMRAGDRFQVVRAAAIEAAHRDTSGKGERAGDRALVELARRFADHEGTQEADTYFWGARGIGFNMRGRWKESRAALERGQLAPLHGTPGFSTVRLFDTYTCFFMGDLNEGRRRVRRLQDEARERGDLYTSVNLGTSMAPLYACADDDPDRARGEIRDALAQWPTNRYYVQHWQALVYGVEVELYAGQFARAAAMLEEQRPALEKSLLLHVGFVRAMTCFTRGRVAVASLASRPDLRRELLAEARRMIRALGREHDPWTGILAALLQASVDNAAGAHDAAIAALRAASAKEETSETNVYMMTARYRLGEALQGDQGRTLRDQAMAEMNAQGIRNPLRWVAGYLPGVWPAA